MVCIDVGSLTAIACRGGDTLLPTLREEYTYHEVEPRKERKLGWLHAQDVDVVVNEVTLTADEAVPWGHCVQAPQLTWQTVPALASASLQEAANSLVPQVEVQARSVLDAKMSGPIEYAVLPLMVTDIGSIVKLPLSEYIPPP